MLDVFARSGTTGAVALDLGRGFVGYEINGDFCRLCRERLEGLGGVMINRMITEIAVRILPKFILD